MRNEIEKKIELLMSPLWNSADIAVYFNVSQATAYRIREEVKEKFGSSSYGKKYVNRDSVLKLYDTSAESEIKKLRLFIANEKEL